MTLNKLQYVCVCVCVCVFTVMKEHVNHYKSGSLMYF